jgi:hypothetical protein
MPTPLDDVSNSLLRLGSWATTASIITALVSASTIAMAFIQVFKDFTPIRRAFQRHWIEDWISRRAGSFNNRARAFPDPRERIPSADATVLQRYLIELATGGEANAFYDLQAEQLVAQMNAAAQIALDYPTHRSNFELIATISEGADIADVVLLRTVPSVRQAAAAPAQGGAAPGLPAGYTDARNRVGHRIQRNLDGLQIAMRDRWQLHMQLAAQIISILVIEVAVYAYSSWSPSPWSVVLAIPVAVIGGYFAPVLRDLVAALQGLRK